MNKITENPAVIKITENPAVIKFIFADQLKHVLSDINVGLVLTVVAVNRQTEEVWMTYDMDQYKANSANLADKG